MLSISFKKNEVVFQLEAQDNEDTLKCSIFAWVTGMWLENNPPKEFSELIKPYRLYETLHKRINNLEVQREGVYEIHLDGEVYNIKSSPEGEFRCVCRV